MIGTRPGLVSTARRRVALPLSAVLLLGAVLRFVPIWFGLPFDRARPDEETAIGHAAAILGGDLHPHFFHWPSLTFYVFAAAFAVVSAIHRLLGLGPALSGNEQYLVARGVVALAGTATLVTLFLAVRLIADDGTALVAALFLAVTPLHVRESHFAMTDVIMTLFVTLALALLLRAIALSANAPADGRSLRWDAAAAFAGGLATSTKYTGAVILGAFAAAQWVRVTRMPEHRWRSTICSTVVMATAFVGGFVAGTPYALLDWHAFASGVGFDIAHLSTGHAFLDLGFGWTYHLDHSLRYGLSTPLLVAAILGAIVLAAASRSAAIVIGAFCGSLYAVLGPGRTVFFRYVLPIVPMACASAALAVRQFALWVSRHVSARALLGPLAAAVALPALVNSVWLDFLLARTDTRVIAGRWLAAHLTADQSVYDAGGVYAGASLLGVDAHHWSADTFDAAHNTFRDSDGQLPDWVVLPESPLVYGMVPPDLRHLAAEKYQLVQTVPAARAPTDDSVYDRQDAFFLPIAGFRSIIRPGPSIRIYRRLQN